MPQKRPKQAVTPQFAVEMWPIDRPQDYPNNARKWTDKAVAKVAVSIREFGWRQPVVVDSQGVIVIGHLRRGQEHWTQRVPGARGGRLEPGEDPRTAPGG